MSRFLLLLVLLVTGSWAAEDPLRQRLADQHPPWYDRSTDSWHRVAVKPPEQAPTEAVPHGSLLAADIVAWLLVAVVAVALAWLLVQLWPQDAPELAPLPEPARRPPARPHAIAELDLGDERDPEAALAAARAAGDWRRAVVWLYALLLVRLDAAGTIRLRKGATNRRYVRDAESWVRANQGHSPLVPCLGLAINAFEQVYFGGLNATAEQVDGLEGRVRAAIANLPEEPAA